jgi:hypothetical protein
MPSSLPTDPALDKAVKDFGIGPYDSQLDYTEHGEDDEERQPAGKSLPDGGGGDDFPIEYYLSYPQETALGIYSTDRTSESSLPGDISRPPTCPSPASYTFDDVLPTSNTPAIFKDDEEEEEQEQSERNEKTYHSELPQGDFPVARSDYYDRMSWGTITRNKAPSDIWALEDSGAYVSGEMEDGEGSNLPSPSSNEVSMDDFLGALGNSWQGFVTEDLSDPKGFPSTDFSENADYPVSNDGVGYVIAHSDTSNTHVDMDNTMNTRKATDLELVKSLTKEFLKEYGKKNIVRRQVLAFLQNKSLPQYLASDIVRCMKHEHKIVIPDVMDRFPIIAAETRSKVANVWNDIIKLEIKNITDSEVSSVCRRSAADLAHVMAALEKLEGPNG